MDISDIMPPATSTLTPSLELRTSQGTGNVSPKRDEVAAQDISFGEGSRALRPVTSSTSSSNSRKTFSTLRPAPGLDVTDTHRQMEVAASNFPKRARMWETDSSALEQPSLSKFISGLWEQIHSSIILEPQLLQGQALFTSLSNRDTYGHVNNDTTNCEDSSSAPVAAPSSIALAGDIEDTFSHSSVVCRKVTQTSRTCRSVEVIVQARWIDEFDKYVDRLATTNPKMSKTRCRKCTLMMACRDFGWSEKELRNKMAVWRGYKEIKDVAGWAALVFSGMGLYRLCKYRIGLDQKGLDALKCLKSRLEVAADTIHPQWRQLLFLVGEDTRCVFHGHPHDWAVDLHGSHPVPLRSTYIESDPFFTFEHLDDSVIDRQAWGGDDPRYVPPNSVTAGFSKCNECGQKQSDDAIQNQCYCFPALFGGARQPAMVQVFRTLDGRNNGVQALTPVKRGVAIGEFVGFVTKDVEDMDVMRDSNGVRSYQIWQGRQGNFSRFINHSCHPNAQFQHFTWLSTQRIILVSKGIEAGREITVDYSESYWAGLNKRCLCGTASCRYH